MRGRSRWTSDSTNQRDAEGWQHAGRQAGRPRSTTASLAESRAAETAVPAWDEQRSLSTGARAQGRGRRRRGFRLRRAARQVIGRDEVTEASPITQDCR
jgi:hypothetical protein